MKKFRYNKNTNGKKETEFTNAQKREKGDYKSH